MTKELTNGQLREIGFALAKAWNSQKAQIKLTGKDLFHLLQLKHEIDQQNSVLNEAFMAIGEAHGGTPNEQGNLQIPEDEVAAVNKELTEIALQKTSIEYTPIKIKEDSGLPVDLMEILLDFLEVE